MVFIVCVIEPEKITESMDAYITATLLFTQTKQLDMARHAFPDGGCLGVNDTQSCDLFASPLSDSVVQGPVATSLAHNLTKLFQVSCNPPSIPNVLYYICEVTEKQCNWETDELISTQL